MGAIIKHTKEDIKKFEAEICSGCHCADGCRCTFENMQEHIPNCPRFFNFMIGYKSFIEEQLEYEREHPEYVEEKRRKNLELSAHIKSLRKTKKKS